MLGVDLSHWNKVDWKKLSKHTSFAIIKATQGISFVDPEFKNNQRLARKYQVPLGYYHFASGYASPKQEAEHFIKTIGDLEIGELLTLDWEIQHHNPVQWCLQFLEEVEKMTNVKPLIYLNVATLKRYDWSPVAKNDNGLWIAYYGWNFGMPKRKPPSYAWDFWAIWQYTSRGFIPGVKGFVDKNYTSMDIETLKKYGYQSTPGCVRARKKVTKYTKKLSKWQKIMKKECKI